MHSQWHDVGDHRPLAHPAPGGPMPGGQGEEVEGGGDSCSCSWALMVKGDDGNERRNR